MKKIILIASALALSLISCSSDDSSENTPTIPTSIPIQEDVTHDIVLDAIDLSTPGQINETITIDIEYINTFIESNLASPASIEDILINDLIISLAEGSGQTNFDFVDSLNATIYSDAPNSNSIDVDFGTIEKGVDKLALPDSVNSTSLLELIQTDGVTEIIIDLDFVTNTAIDDDIELELTSSLIALITAAL